MRGCAGLAGDKRAMTFNRNLICMTFLYSHHSRRRVLQLVPAAASAHMLPAWAQAAPPKRRLITISGSITEVVFELGAQLLLVATDTTSLYPDAAQKTAKVGYMRQLSAEGVLSLKPDAVIATTEAGPPVVIDQIRSAGIVVDLIQSDHTWAEVGRKVTAVGKAAQLESQARVLQTRLDAEWAATQQRVVQAVRAGRQPRVLFILSHSATPQVSGGKTAAHAVIAYAGGINVMGGFDGYRPMTAEAMASAAPDVILSSTQSIDAHGGVDKFWQRPELALTPAFRKRALVTMEASKLLGFGPRLPAAVREIHEKLLAV